MKDKLTKIEIQFFSDSQNSESSEKKDGYMTISENEESTNISKDTNAVEENITNNSADGSFFNSIEFSTSPSFGATDDFQEDETCVESDSGDALSEVPNGEDGKDDKNNGKAFLSFVFDLVEVFAYALAMMIVVFLFVFKFVTVDGHSMLGTLHHEDRLVVYNLFYYPETNDVIVINLEERDELLVKRIIGVEGDEVKIDFDTWEIWVNNEKIPQPYLMNSPEYNIKPMEKGSFTSTDEENCVSFKVEKGKVFVLGDNRNHSSDSRVFGQMEIEEILGKVVFRVFPFENAGKIS